MAGENTGETPDGSQVAEALELLRGIKAGMDTLTGVLERYAPALERAAAVAGSPAGKLAARVTGFRK